MKKQLTLLTVLFISIVAFALSGCASQAQASPVVQVTPDSSMVNRVVAEGRLEPVRGLDLAFASSGRVAEVLVEEGQSVEAGQVLARLEGAQNYQAQAAAAQLEQLAAEQDLQHLREKAFLKLASAAAEIEAARKAYDAVVSSWTGGNAKYPTTFDAALKEYIDAEKAVRDAQTKVDSQRDQPEDAPARTQAEKRLSDELERRSSAYQTLLANYEQPREGTNTENRTPLVQAVARLEAAMLDLNKLKGQADPEQEALLQARIEAASAAQAAAQQNLSTLELKAPFAGQLFNWDLEAGEFVIPGQVTGALADTSSWVVETTDLSENDVVLLQVGSPVKVTVNALPGETFSGVVESINGKGEKIQGDMTYQVRIRMDQNSPRWYWNLVVKVTAE